MFSIIPKRKIITVEEIHHEFDTAEERILEECNKVLLQSSNIDELKEERKVKLLREAGFVNSEFITQAEPILTEKSKKQNQIKLAENQRFSIIDLKQKHPLDKFLTIQELERICKKYKLIIGPVSNYIKDVPEKNLLEIKNRKTLLLSDCANHIFMYQRSGYEYEIPSDILQWLKTYKITTISHESYHSSALQEIMNNCPIKNKTQLKKLYSALNRSFTIQKINRSGLFIIAPNSHFNLKDLKKESSYGFFKTEQVIVNDDPIAIEYCKTDICRIITKWGTKDDQSYLDPLLTNEIQN